MLLAESGSLNTPVDDRAWRDFWDKATNTRYPKHDPNYRAGREIYLGRGPHPRYRYCLAQDADAPRLKLSRKNLKPYRGLPVTEFVQVLYDCDEPQVQVLGKLPKQQAGLVVYYLHKRYKLRLQQKQQGVPPKSAVTPPVTSGPSANKGIKP
ncbi:MAG: hypothetical protein KJO24_04055 [Gammaproteobacteria bacterium]|nr:hypothetical protein [Gammaproteobacteria bacterium]